MKLIVSDAGPLIALSRIGRLGLLSDIFETIYIPGVVLDELKLEQLRSGVQSLAEAVLHAKWLMRRNPRVRAAISGIDPGETAAMHLAQELACPLLINERRARTAASKRGLTTIGTGRVLIAAKEKGLIDRVAVVLEELKTTGYRLSDDLCNRLLSAVKEL